MVKNGIDILDIESLKKYRIGLVVNYSSINSNGELLIDLLIANGIKLMKIFVPEHGLYITADGEKVIDFVHPKLGIPVYSIYGVREHVESELLRDIDLLIYDIQDVGLRYYTFIYALANMLRSASMCGIKMVVLDRFNLLGRKVFGRRISKDINSLVGAYELPIQYGLTTGELALYFKKYLKFDVDLEIIRCQSWNGENFSETGLRWNLPSPNLPTFSSLLCYAGLCLFEATNLSVGRGTTKPFEFLGAPWIDEDNMYRYLRSKFPRLFIRKRQFVPQFREYAHNVCSGVEFFPSTNDNFFEVAVSLFEYFEKYEEFQVDNRRIDMLSGVENFIQNKEEILQFDTEDYQEFVKDILLYEVPLKY